MSHSPAFSGTPPTPVTDDVVHAARTATGSNSAARLWSLRFLNGPLRDRAFAVQGTLAVGSAPDSDILLPSTEVASRHLVFTAGNLSLVMQRVADAQVRLNGQAVETQRRSVVAGDILSIGKTDIQIDHVYARSAPHEADCADSMFLPDSDELPPLRFQSDRHRKKPAMAVGWLLMALGVGALLPWGWDNIRQSSQATGASATSAQRGLVRSRLETVLRDFADVEVSSTPDGAIHLKGYVETRVRLDVLRSELQRVDPHIHVQVQAADDLVDQAIRFIADPAVTLAYVGKGRLLATGSVEGPTTRERIKQLNSDWQPAAFIDDQLKVRVAQAKPKSGAEADDVAFWQRQLPARLVSVTEAADGLRHVQLANGHRYFEGSILNSGAEIKRVDAQQGLEILPGKGGR